MLSQGSRMDITGTGRSSQQAYVPGQQSKIRSLPFHDGPMVVGGLTSWSCFPLSQLLSTKKMHQKTKRAVPMTAPYCRLRKRKTVAKSLGAVVWHGPLFYREGLGQNFGTRQDVFVNLLMENCFTFHRKYQLFCRKFQDLVIFLRSLKPK